MLSWARIYRRRKNKENQDTVPINSPLGKVTCWVPGSIYIGPSTSGRQVVAHRRHGSTYSTFPCLHRCLQQHQRTRVCPRRRVFLPPPPQCPVRLTYPVRSHKKRHPTGGRLNEILGIGQDAGVNPSSGRCDGYLRNAPRAVKDPKGEWLAKNFLGLARRLVSCVPRTSRTGRVCAGRDQAGRRGSTRLTGLPSALEGIKTKEKASAKRDLAVRETPGCDSKGPS